MKTWQDLRSDLVELHENDNVYYQPPESLKMQYSAIRFSRKNIDVKYANNTAHIMRNCYEVIVIDKKPNNPVIEKLLAMPYCSYDRHYVADNLHHDVLTLYY